MIHKRAVDVVSMCKLPEVQASLPAIFFMKMEAIKSYFWLPSCFLKENLTTVYFCDVCQ